MLDESRQRLLEEASSSDSHFAMRTGQTIYLDYQASTPIDPVVLEAMAAAWRDDFANPQSADHVLGWRAQQSIEAAASSVGAFVGVPSDQVVFTSGATEANWLAISGVAAMTERRRIVVSSIEHKSVLTAAQEAARRFNLALDIVDVDGEGLVGADALAQQLGDDVALVSLMAVNNEIGSINDIASLGEAVARVGAVFHVDASQAPSACDLIDIVASADLATLSSHKAYGPKGIGAVIMGAGMHDQLRPLHPGTGSLRAGTLAPALCVGFASALERMNECGADERHAVARLRDRLVAQLEDRTGAQLIGPQRLRRHPGNACLGFEGLDGADLLSALQPFVAGSTQSACNSGVVEPSAVLLAIGLDRDTAQSCVRLSLGRFSDEAQIDEAADYIVAAVKARRRGARA
jgi:cysteine desulfurase